MELIYQKDAGTQSNVTEHKTLPYSSPESAGNDHNVFHSGVEKQDIYSKKLKRLRLNHLLCQKEMADKFSISQQSYAKLEAGKTIFTVKKIEKICKIFNISFNEFITISDNEKICASAIESYNTKVLKAHYEGLLLQKDIRINELEIKFLQKRKHLKK
ncbi:MAG: family transcriptional regulator [Bacteroidota bacterium]|jgi:transcriptional regulator with XRE-family HTH domain|nr:family transcriptional regulator [Bacteroidota bacterium]